MKDSPLPPKAPRRTNACGPADKMSARVHISYLRAIKYADLFLLFAAGSKHHFRAHQQQQSGQVFGLSHVAVFEYGRGGLVEG